MPRRLRILHIGNGKAFKIKAIVDAFVERGHELHMVPIPAIEGHWDGVTWHRLPESKLPGQAKVVVRMSQVRRLADRLRPDVVHAHNAWGPGWYGAATGRHPFVIHAYGGDLLPEQYAGRPALQRRLTSWSCQRAERIIVTGRHMISASTSLGISPDRVTLLPRGVDVERYRPGLDTSELRQQLGLADAWPIMLSPRYQVGETLYNLDVVVDACRLVRNRFPRAMCVQMYDPSSTGGLSRLKRLVADNGLDQAYRFVPAVGNAGMPWFYNLADVVVSVPSSDGFPVTVLEASACAAPLIVSDLPYCREWFETGVNGVVVPVRDAAALADAIVTLVDDEPLRRAIGAAARRLVVAKADYRRCMDDLEAVYHHLLEGRATRRETN